MGLPFPHLDAQRVARTSPKAKKGAAKSGPRTGLEKGLCLEGAEPLKVTTVTHFQLFLRRPKAPKKESKRERKGSPNRENPSLKHPWASLWPLVGSIFEPLASTLFFNTVQAHNWRPPPPKMGRLRWGRHPSGVVGIVHFSVLEEVIVWVLASFSIFRLCAAP